MVRTAQWRPLEHCTSRSRYHSLPPRQHALRKHRSPIRSRSSSRNGTHFRILLDRGPSRAHRSLRTDRCSAQVEKLRAERPGRGIYLCPVIEREKEHGQRNFHPSHTPQRTRPQLRTRKPRTSSLASRSGSSVEGEDRCTHVDRWKGGNDEGPA